MVGKDRTSEDRDLLRDTMLAKYERWSYAVNLAAAAASLSENGYRVLLTTFSRARKSGSSSSRSLTQA